MTEPTIAPTVQLTNGAVMPSLGLGTYPMDDAECERVIPDAVAAGYRLIDTAELYGNERGVGRGVRASGIAREELFVTTKLSRRWHGSDLAIQAFENSLERLGLDYVDLYLIHWPNPAADLYVQTWEALTQLLADERVRAIGVSNFKPAHLDRIVNEIGIVPDVNQIELSPTLTREISREADAKLEIVTQSWSPIGGGENAVLAEPTIAEIAEEVGRTPAQVVLRWHVQQGLVPIPKSSNHQRLRENLNVFDFELTPDQVNAINALDRGEQAAVDSDVFPGG